MAVRHSRSPSPFWCCFTSIILFNILIIIITSTTTAHAALTALHTPTPSIPYPRGWPPAKPLTVDTLPSIDLSTSDAGPNAHLLGYGERLALHTPIVVITAMGLARTEDTPTVPPAEVDSTVPAGCAYMFCMPGGAADPAAGWSLIGPALTAATPTAGDRFGWAVDAVVMDDGNTVAGVIAPGDAFVAVGAPGAAAGRGDVHVFHVPAASTSCSSSTWTRINNDFGASGFTPSDGRLGTSVAISQLDGVPFLAFGVPLVSSGGGGARIWALYPTASDMSEWTRVASYSHWSGTGLGAVLAMDGPILVLCDWCEGSCGSLYCRMLRQDNVGDYTSDWDESGDEDVYLLGLAPRSLALDVDPATGRGLYCVGDPMYAQDGPTVRCFVKQDVADMSGDWQNDNFWAEISVSRASPAGFGSSIAVSVSEGASGLLVGSWDGSPPQWFTLAQTGAYEGSNDYALRADLTYKLWNLEASVELSVATGTVLPTGVAFGRAVAIHGRTAMASTVHTAATNAANDAAITISAIPHYDIPFSHVMARGSGFGSAVVFEESVGYLAVAFETKYRDEVTFMEGVHILQRNPDAASFHAEDAWVATGYASHVPLDTEWSGSSHCHPRLAAAGFALFFAASDSVTCEQHRANPPSSELHQLSPSSPGDPAGNWAVTGSHDLGAQIGAAIAAAGNVLAVPLEDGAASSVRVLRPDFGANATAPPLWQPRANLTNPDVALDTSFGIALAVLVSSPTLGQDVAAPTSDYAVVLLGAPGGGQVHVFDATDAADSDSAWSLTASLEPPIGAVSGSGATAAEAACGTAIAVHTGHTTLAMGCPSANTVHIFTRAASLQPGTAGAWSWSAMVTAPDSLVGDLFGSGLALGGDMLVVGAPGADVEAYKDFGMVHIFEQAEGGWTSKGSIAPEVPPYEADQPYSTSEGVQYGAKVIYEQATGLFTAPAVRLFHRAYSVGVARGAGSLSFFNATQAAAVHLNHDSLLSAAMASGCTTAHFDDRPSVMLLPESGEVTVPGGGLPIRAPCTMRPVASTAATPPVLRASYYSLPGDTTMVLVQDTTLDIANVTLDGGDVARCLSVAAVAATSAEVTATNVQLQRGYSSSAGRGGGLLVTGQGAKATVVNSEVSHSTAELGGGCTAVESGGELLASQMELRNCSSSRGGGLVVTNSATATLTDATLSLNTAQVGGGILVSESSSLSLSTCSLHGNTATDGSGGALSADTWSQATVTASTMNNNTASFQGGAAFVGLRSTLTVNDCTFQYCSASQGAGIVVSGGQATVNSGTIIDNEASDAGGGLFIGQSSEGAVTQLTNCTVERNSARVTAGGLLATRALVALTNCSLRHNTAAEGGGAVAQLQSHLTLVYTHVLENVASSLGGGGLLAADSTLDLTNVTVLGNSAASSNSGGIGCIQAATCSLQECVVDWNSVGDGGQGGGVYVQGSSATASGLLVRHNAAAFGGGLACMASSTCIIGTATVSSNAATGIDGGSGGGVAADGSVVTLTSCSIVDNDADEGGGMACIQGSICSCSHGTLDYNRASGHGGGASILNSGLAMANSSVSSNTAGATPGRRLATTINWARGGGLHVSLNEATRSSGASVELSDTSLSYNMAGLGGALSAAVDVDNATCAASPLTCVADAGVVPVVSLHAGVSVVDNAASVAGPALHWTNRRIGGVVGAVLSDDASLSSTPPVALQLNASDVSVVSGAVAVPIVLTAVDVHGKLAASAELAFEAAAIRALDANSQVVLRGSTAAAFDAVTATAVLSGLIVSAPPGSVHLLEVHATPNALGMLSAILNVTVQLCSPGSAPPSATAHDCVPCAMQTFSTHGVECLPCEAGSVTFSTGSTECTPCSPGAIVVSGKCNPCEAGTISGNPQDSSCAICAQGWVAPQSGMTECIECGAGQVANAQHTVCDPCPIGAVNANASASSTCTTCEEGFVAPREGMDECELCPPGSLSSALRDECQACAKGSFVADARNGTCLPCPPGSVAPRTGMDECEPCLPGTLPSALGDSCIPCVPGLASSNPQDSSCHACPQGHIAPQAGMTSCTACPLGHIANALQTACEPCGEGSVNANASASNVCGLCPLGHVAPQAGMAACQLCPPGTLSSDLRTECQECAKGSFVADARNGTCLPCPPGSVAPTAGTQKCSPCPAGSIVSPLRDACLPCSVGSASSSPQDSSCAPCLPGWVAPQSGMAQCVQCELGAISSPSNDACLRCGTGSYSNTSSSVCTQCEAGRFAPTTGTVQCSPCQRGTLPSQLQDQCDSCDVGMVAPLAGSSECQPCLPGTAPNSLMTRCLPCPAGTTSIDGSNCEPCAKGSIANHNSTSCEPCPRGTFAAKEGSVICTPCDLDTYSAGLGESSAAACVACPENTITIALGASNASHCRPQPGFVVLDNGDTLECPEGFDCDGKEGASSVEELALAPGFWKASRSTLNARACPNPAYCKGGVGGGTQASAGVCSPHHHGPYCELCDDGYYITNDECTVCPENAVGDVILALLFVAFIVAAIVFALAWLLPRIVAWYSRRKVAKRQAREERYQAQYGDVAAQVRELRKQKRQQRKLEHSGSSKVMPHADAAQQSQEDALANPLSKPDPLLAATGHSSWAAGAGGQRIAPLESVASAVAQQGSSSSSDDEGPELAAVAAAAVALRADAKTARAVVLRRRQMAGTYNESAKKSKQLKGVVQKVKLLIGFLQVLASFQSSFTVSWPASVSRWFSRLAFVNLEVLKLLNTSCVMHRNVYHDLVLVSVLPIVVALVLAAVAYVRYRRAKEASERSAAAAKGANWILFWSFLIYTGVSAKVFSVFACEDFEDGTSFLKADYSVSCLAANRGAWLFYAVAVVALYPLGIPCAYIVIMFRQRHRINPSSITLPDGSQLHRGDQGFTNEVLLARTEDSSIAWSQFLWAAYEPHAFYFEALEMLRKVMLTGAIVFFSPGTPTQVATAMIITVTMLSITGIIQPFLLAIDDFIAVVAAYQLLLTLLGGLLMSSGVAAADGYTEQMGPILVATNVLTVVCIFLSIIASGVLARWHQVNFKFPHVTPASMNGVRIFVGLKPLVDARGRSTKRKELQLHSMRRIDVQASSERSLDGGNGGRGAPRAGGHAAITAMQVLDDNESDDTPQGDAGQAKVHDNAGTAGAGVGAAFGEEPSSES